MNIYSKYAAAAAATVGLAMSPITFAQTLPVYTGVDHTITYSSGGFGQQSIVPTGLPPSVPGIPNTGSSGVTGPVYFGVDTTITYSSGGFGQQAIIPTL